MQQMMKLLALPALELKAYLENAILENPLLELEEKRPQDTERPERSVSQEPGEYEPEEVSALSEPEQIQKKRDYKESIISRPPTLQEDLVEQLHLLNLTPQDYKIGEFIIGNLDDDGYLRTGVEEMARLLGESAEDVEWTLKVIQTLEPAGVAARSLSECLIIQLRRKGAESPLAQEIIKNHLQDLAMKHYEKLASALGKNIDEIKGAAKLISGLAPKPAANIYAKESEAVVPDVIVRAKDEGFEISLTDNIPRVKINADCKNLSEKEKSKEERNYIAKNLSAARTLVRGLRDRDETIIRVVNEIFRRQENFLQEGPSDIKPLKLEDVARRLGLHQSTVSRVVSTKYIDTPFGIYPLRFFFSRELRAETGEKIATKKIKLELKEVVEKEDKSCPLSDEEIVKIFGERGIKIARRTVAKYRDELKILPSSLRKK